MTVIGVDPHKHSHTATVRAPTLAASRDLSEIRTLFAGTGVSWGPYQTFRQLVDEYPRVSLANPMFTAVTQPGAGRYLMPASPLDFTGTGRLPAAPAPTLGQHTEEILADVLGLSASEIGALHDRVVLAGPVGARAAY